MSLTSKQVHFRSGVVAVAGKFRGLAVVEIVIFRFLSSLCCRYGSITIASMATVLATKAHYDAEENYYCEVDEWIMNAASHHKTMGIVGRASKGGSRCANFYICWFRS
jgi:hypothetical protein